MGADEQRARGREHLRDGGEAAQVRLLGALLTSMARTDERRARTKSTARSPTRRQVASTSGPTVATRCAPTAVSTSRPRNVRPVRTSSGSSASNRQPTIVVDGARLTSYAGGHTVEVGEIALERVDLFAIEALGPRGEPSRRIHTVRHRLEVRLGPDTVLGQLHITPGGRPLVAIGQLSPMIPLTNATIAFNTDGGVEALDMYTLIINRSLADGVRADLDELPAFAAVPVAAPHRAI